MGRKESVTRHVRSTLVLAVTCSLCAAYSAGHKRRELERKSRRVRLLDAYAPRLWVMTGRWAFPSRAGDSDFWCVLDVGCAGENGRLPVSDLQHPAHAYARNAARFPPSPNWEGGLLQTRVLIVFAFPRPLIPVQLGSESGACYGQSRLDSQHPNPLIERSR